MSATPHSLRAVVVACLDGAPHYLTAFDIAQRTGLPYKSVIDALSVLHAQARVLRIGRKFSARWGSVRLAQQPGHVQAWGMLAAVWFGPAMKARR